MVKKTDFQGKHKDFTISARDEVLEADMDWLVKYLTVAISEGTKFEPNQIIQFGWSMALIVDKGSFLELHEPDLRSFPLKFENGVTGILMHLRLQKEVFESFKIRAPISFPSINQSVLIGSDLIDCKEFVLNRVQPEADDSGWFVGCSKSKLNYNDASNLTRISLYQLIVSYPQLIEFLALPAESTVDLTKKNPTVYFMNRKLKAKEESYFASKYQ